MTPLETGLHAALVGAGATAVMDAWLALVARLGGRKADFAMVGRWVGHLVRGRVRHAAIAQAAPVPAERALGWAAHYAVGVAFAGLLVALQGAGWLAAPTPGPALAFGLASVAVPLFVLQPAMGAGVASRRTAAPVANTLRSVASHVAFGAGLYAAAVVLAARSA